MRRRAFAILAAISFLFSAVSAAFWVDGWSLKWWYANWQASGDIAFSAIATRRVYIASVTFIDPQYLPYAEETEARRISDDGDLALMSYEDEATRNGVYFGGFGAGMVSATAPRVAFVSVPQWFCVVVFVVPPLVWLKCRKSRHASGHCIKCGYDLRASKGACPECGETKPHPA